MKFLLYILLIITFIVGCNTTKVTSSSDKAINNSQVNDTVRIANDDLEYEIIIIEPGFQSWLVSTAKPEGFYSQSYLENKNLIYVTEWNNRVSQPFRYNPNLYEMSINYLPGIDYGYEVNYKLYNYFIYFQLKYRQKLAGTIPRI